MGQRFEYAITIALLLAIFFAEADSRKQHTEEGLLSKWRLTRHRGSSSSSSRSSSPRGPHFLRDTPGNVTAQLGGRASLPCRVKNLGDHGVYWYRQRDLQILTGNQERYTKDERFTVSHDPQTQAWNLTVRDVQEKDAGRYQCELRIGGRQRVHAVDLVVKSMQPQFDPDTPANVSAQLGESAFLPCRIKNLGDKFVSWIRIRDWHIMTVDRDTYIADERFTASHDPQTETWTLTVRDVQERDAGAYSCEVSTHPKMTHAVDLVVMKDLTTTTEKPPGLTTHRQDVSSMSRVPHSNTCHDLEARLTKLGLHDAFLAQMQSVSSIVTFLEEKEARLVKLQQGHQPRGHTDPPSA